MCVRVVMRHHALKSAERENASDVIFDHFSDKLSIKARDLCKLPSMQGSNLGLRTAYTHALVER